jgi:hypothetical protein
VFPTLLSCFFLFRRKLHKSLRILERVISIPTAPTKTSLILLPFHTCTSQNKLIDA